MEMEEEAEYTQKPVEGGCSNAELEVRRTTLVRAGPGEGSISTGTGALCLIFPLDPYYIEMSKRYISVSPQVT